MPDDDRRYDDREVGLILKRVAELHERDGHKADARSLTQAEIEEVVGDLGISRSLVTRAASELSVRDVRNQSVWRLGGKTDLMFEDAVDGEIDEATHSLMLEVLRRYLGDPGELRVEGNARIWATTSATSRRIHFSVVQHDDSTTLRLEERMPMDARTTVAGPTMAGGFAGFMAILPLKALVVKSVLLMAMAPMAGAGAVAGWLVGRQIWKRRSNGREHALGRAFGEIVSVGRERRRALPPADST